MKIGISAVHIRPGKSGSHQPYLVNLVNALSDLVTSHEFLLFVTLTNRHLFEKAHARMEFVVYPRIVNGVLPRILFEQVGLPLDARRMKIDVMHYAGTAGSFLMRGSDVVTIHHDSVTNRMSMSRIRNLYFDAASMINRKAGQIIAPSQVYADQLVKYFGYHPDRVQPVHHGVSPIFRKVSKNEVEKTRCKYGIEQNAILSVTNTRPHKNNLNLLRVYNHLLMKYHLETQLVMVGNINEVVLERLIYETAEDPQYVRSHIKVIPFLPHEQLPSIYSASTAFVTLSRIESFGMPVVEAMASGLPVIASDIPIHREILQDAGVLVSPDAPEESAAALYRIFTDGRYRRLLEQSSLVRSHNFSWEKTARETLQVYENAWSSVHQN